MVQLDKMKLGGMIMSMAELGKSYYLRKSKHRKRKIWGST